MSVVRTSGVRNMASGRTAKMESPSPIPIPTAVSEALCPSTNFRMPPGVAPNATRRPISRMRRLTEYKRTP